MALADHWFNVGKGFLELAIEGTGGEKRCLAHRSLAYISRSPGHIPHASLTFFLVVASDASQAVSLGCWSVQPWYRLTMQPVTGT
jgi:hypothetical protein